MNAKHTPGPWVLESRGNGTYDIKANRKDRYGIRTIAIVEEDALPVDESWYNARLIAAAPELLERLTDIISFVKKDLKERNIPFCFTGAEDAIKKALGE